MIPLVVIRPQPGCSATVEQAGWLGLEAYGFPMFEVAAVDWSLPADPIDALLIGSANAIRLAGPSLTRLAGHPVYAVGETTARTAEAAGFALAAVGCGGLQTVLGRIDTSHRTLLRLCGTDRVALHPPPDLTIIERPVYSSRPFKMPEGLRRTLRQPCVVVLHSAIAAQYFAEQCAAHAIDRSPIAVVAIGPRVAEAAGGGWAKVAFAEKPTDAALLAIARSLCQTAID